MKHQDATAIPVLLTKREVASILRVSTKTIDNYCDREKQPRLSFVQLPGARRFDTNDLQRFISERKFGSHSPSTALTIGD